MKEKINEYSIDRPLTSGRRQKIDHFIESNAGRLGRPVSHRWDESGSALLLESSPVQWEFVFHPKRVEAFGSAPLWVKLLFTEKRRNALDEMILQMLEEAGFFAPSPSRSAKAKDPVGAPRARKTTSPP